MQDNFPGWPELVLQHLHWYPLMQARDIYKLVYQGVMGAEHLVSSPEHFTRQLAEEFESLPPEQDGRLLEPVRPDQALLRLNLGVYKIHHGQVISLFTPLLETGARPPGSLTALRATWTGLVVACDQGHIPGFEPGNMDAFTSWLEGMRFPSVHHSPVYRQHYRPAYRLISYQSAHQLGLDRAG